MTNDREGISGPFRTAWTIERVVNPRSGGFFTTPVGSWQAEVDGSLMSRGDIRQAAEEEGRKG